MKTTSFFNEVKKVANASLKNTFAYNVNCDKSFYCIVLNEEPTEEVKSMCEDNGFGIKENILHYNDEGKMLSRHIWEVMPADVNDVEYVEE